MINRMTNPMTNPTTSPMTNPVARGTNSPALRRRRRGTTLLLCLLAIAAFARTANSQQRIEDNEFLRRVFQKHEFSARPFGPARWLKGGEAYTTVETSPSAHDALDVVRYETATGKREVMISASDLVPAGAKEPLEIQDYDWSADMNRVLVYTNSQRVWRQNSRGDYWVFDRQAKTLRKLGGDFEPATLMFATFSPDGSKVAYVHKNNVYVEDVQSGAITQLTHDGSETIINGTSDWVYEEELDIRNAYRWSPDGKRIAYWQFNTGTVKNFASDLQRRRAVPRVNAHSVSGVWLVSVRERNPLP